MKTGKVYLIGAGPGDPGLITVKGLACLRQADVVIYDHLLDNRLLDSAKPYARLIFVGKSASRHNLEQSEINKLLVEHALAGKSVARLKGGDPFVFGRGGEEAEVLKENGIPFEVIPGVSSSIAVPAYAGIPVTHRGIASSFAVVTGHESTIKDKSAVDWSKISQAADTVVVLMSVNNLNSIVANLMKNGRDASTPAAIITQGTGSQQVTLTGNLDNIVAMAETAEIEPPGVLVVGEVVRLSEKLSWFGKSPFFGKTMLVTRPRHQSHNFIDMLLSRGAIPLEMPVIKIVPDYPKIDRAVQDLETYNWIIFTSVNAVELFFQRMFLKGMDTRKLLHIEIGAIGKATAEALAGKGLIADFVPRKFTSRNLLTGLKTKDLSGASVLLPRADVADKSLFAGLIKLGAQVEEIAIYHTELDRKGLPDFRKMLKKDKIDIITFTSSSTVSSLVAISGKNRTLLNKSLIACIGPVTASTAKKAGLKVDIVARKYTMLGLLEAIEEYLREERRE